MKIVNGLALNGGGVFGVQAIHQLTYLHDKMGGSFMRHFDYIGGVSTGGLISGLLAMGFTPQEILYIYNTELANIFDKRFLGQIRGLSKYDNAYLKELATKLVGNVTLGDLNQKLIIPTVNASLSRQKIFKSYDPKDAHYKLVDVLVATAAAPTYFPAHFIEGNWYKDGGLAENNPSEILRKEAKAAQFDKINILNITTGRRPERASRAEQKGNLLSVPSMIDEILDTQDQVTKGHVEFAYKTGDCKGMYIRCESVRKNSAKGIDNTSSSNIKALNEDGKLSIEANKELLNYFYINTLRNE